MSGFLPYIDFRLFVNEPEGRKAVYGEGGFSPIKVSMTTQKTPTPVVQ